MKNLWLVKGGGLRLRGNVNRFRGGLVFKAHSLLYFSTLGTRVIATGVWYEIPVEVSQQKTGGSSPSSSPASRGVELRGADKYNASRGDDKYNDAEIYNEMIRHVIEIPELTTMISDSKYTKIQPLSTEPLWSGEKTTCKDLEAFT